MVDIFCINGNWPFFWEFFNTDGSYKRLIFIFLGFLNMKNYFNNQVFLITFIEYEKKKVKKNFF